MWLLQIFISRTEHSLKSPCALARTETLDSPAPPRASDELIAEPVGAPELEAQWAASALSASVATGTGVSNARLEWKCFCRQSNQSLGLCLFECYGLKFSH
jgi:hypothetical protein